MGTRTKFMPIKSYLAHPHQGRKEELVKALNELNECEVIPAENKEVLILITDTSNKLEEDKLKEQLETIDSLQMLSMVSGFNS